MPSVVEATNIQNTGATVSQTMALFLSKLPVGVKARLTWAHITSSRNVSPVIQNSGNLSSVTDNGNGDFTLRFVSNYSSASSYAAEGLASTNGTDIFLPLVTQASYVLFDRCRFATCDQVGNVGSVTALGTASVYTPMLRGEFA